MVILVPGMSDPSAAQDQPPPPPPPRPQAWTTEYTTSTPKSQLDADAVYARKLQERYGDSLPAARGRAIADQRQRQEQYAREDDDDYYYDSDKEHSFFDGSICYNLMACLLCLHS